MKKILLIPTLILLTGLGFTVTANAQDWNCSDLTWSAERLATSPDIAANCLDVVEKDGIPYAKLHMKIERQSVNATTVRFQKPDNSWSDRDRVFPGGFTATVGGEELQVARMTAGQELNVYVKSEDNFTYPVAEPVVAAAPPPPPPPPPAPEPEPEPEPEYLPTTATQFNLFALLGGLLILMGGMLAVVRTRL